MDCKAKIKLDNQGKIKVFLEFESNEPSESQILSRFRDLVVESGRIGHELYQVDVKGCSEGENNFSGLFTLVPSGINRPDPFIPRKKAWYKFW